MIVLALLASLQAAPAPVAPSATDITPLGAIGKQALPAKGCAAFLWSAAGDRKLVAMATADPALIRLSIDGKTTDYARRSERGVGGFGFAGVGDYAGSDLTATLDMTITPRADLANGAMVPTATLRIDRPGRDTVVLPVAGLIGCRT